MSLIDNRLSSNIIKDENECWLLQKYVTTAGYGRLRWQGSKILAHRLCWIIHNGRIPKGLYVLHRCDVRNCINPAHLWLGTYRDNTRDCWNKGRGKVPSNKGQDNPMSKSNVTARLLEAKKYA